MTTNRSGQLWTSEGQEAVVDPADEALYTNSRQRSSSNTRSSKRQHHPGAALASTSQTGSNPCGKTNLPSISDEVQEEADEYLPPLLASTNKRRHRLNSIESWGSSVMPAALPFANHQRKDRGGLRPRDLPYGRPEEDETALPIASAGLDGWLQSQSHLAPPPTSQSRGDARQHTSQFTSFAPPGRVRRRVESESGSAGGGSLGGWSNGVMSASGRRPVVSRGSGRATTRPTRAGLPLWEGDAGVLEQDESQTSAVVDGHLAAAIPRMASVSSNLSSVLQWRDSSAIPSLSAPTNAKEGRSNRTPVMDTTKGFDHLRVPSLAGSLLAKSASRQSLRPLNLRESRFAEELRNRPEATPMRTFVRGMMKEHLSASVVIGIGLAFLLLAKWAIAAGGWSADVRPGWETSRHWLSLTANLPLNEWYVFDVGHRLLDRPPLAGYLSWCLGSLALTFPTLSKAFGFPPSDTHSPSSHTYMVLVHFASSHLLYVGPVLWFLSKRLADRGRRTRAIVALSVLGQPALMLADYGLGGWQSVSLGLLAVTLALLLTSLPNIDHHAVSTETKDLHIDRVTNLSRTVSYSYIAAVTIFLWAVSFDQSALTFAPAVIALFLGRLSGLACTGTTRGLLFSSGVAVSAALTFLAFFSPWLSFTTTEPLRQILGRLRSRSNPLLIIGDESAAWSISAWDFGNLIYSHLPVSATHASLAAAILTMVFPCLILFRAARETVKIEMRLNESLTSAEQSVTARSLRVPSSISGSVDGRGIPSLRPSRADLRKPDVGTFPRQYRRSTSQAPSDAGSDLRSFAESIVRGDSSVLLSQRASHTVDSTLPAQDEQGENVRISSSCPSPAATVLPYAVAATSMAAYLFFPFSGGYDSDIIRVLYPLLPLTLLTVAKGDEWGGGAGKADWEWIILSNNVGTFSLWPLIRRDGLPLQYVCLVFLWNFLVGYRPFADLSGGRGNVIGRFGAAVHGLMFAVHVFSLGSLLFDPPAALLPTLVNVVSTLALFVVYLWSMKRVAEVALGNGLSIGLGWGRAKAKRRQQQNGKKGQ